MTKEELRDYCYSIGLIDSEFAKWEKSCYTSGYRYDGQFVNPYDFIAAWDEVKQSVAIAKRCEIDEDVFVNEPIRMLDVSFVENDEEIKTRISELIKTVQENIKFLKWKQMKKSIEKIEGDFE